MDTYSTQLQALAQGHGLLAGCALLYLVWWFVFFRPRAAKPEGGEYGFGVVCIGFAAILGVLAITRIVTGLGEFPTNISGVVLWPCAVAVYALLAVVTLKLFHRQITTELLLIVGWAALEVAVVGALMAIGSSIATPLLVLTAIGFVGALVCYLLYYHVSGWAAFLDGCGPLVAVGIIATITAVLL